MEMMNEELPIVVIVGQPNVGKSSLFNAVSGRRISIVHSESGVTRDRISTKVSWNEYGFQLIDTGGIFFYNDEKDKKISDKMNIRKQVEIAIESADVIIFVADISSGGPTALDQDISAMLRKSAKKTILVLNKADNDALDEETRKFTGLSWENVFPISCVHRRGIASMLDRVAEMLPRKVSIADDKVLKIAVVGRPNVGKSSIINRLLKQERVIVSEIPGTTRDSVDIEFKIKSDGRTIRAALVDTAGLRQKRKADTAVEIFSIMRTENSIRQANIVLFVTEADSLGATAQDRKIASMISKANKACIIIANKSDLIDDKEAFRKISGETAYTLPFMSYAPILMCSALSGFNMQKINDLIVKIHEDMGTTLPTALVNRMITKAYERNKPPSDGRKIFKIFYSTMKCAAPPTFIIFANHPELCKENYILYMKNFLRKEMKLTGLPIRIQFRKRT